jgi:hypothetical protein
MIKYSTERDKKYEGENSGENKKIEREEDAWTFAIQHRRKADGY